MFDLRFRCLSFQEGNQNITVPKNRSWNLLIVFDRIISTTYMSMKVSLHVIANPLLITIYFSPFKYLFAQYSSIFRCFPEKYETLNQRKWNMFHYIWRFFLGVEKPVIFLMCKISWCTFTQHTCENKRKCTRMRLHFLIK